MTESKLRTEQTVLEMCEDLWHPKYVDGVFGVQYMYSATPLTDLLYRDNLEDLEGSRATVSSLPCGLRAAKAEPDIAAHLSTGRQKYGPETSDHLDL